MFSRSGTVWSPLAYVKPSNTQNGQQFGYSVSLSADGNALAVSAIYEDSNATGVNGLQSDNSASSSGAVYLFTRTSGVWSQQAYAKASNTDASDSFGYSVSLSSDGNTLAVGAWAEDSTAMGIGGNQGNNSGLNSGAAYMFSRSGTVWSPLAYVKPSNTQNGQQFGISISLSADGSTLAVGSNFESGISTGVGGDQTSNSFTSGQTGAVYLY